MVLRHHNQLFGFGGDFRPNDVFWWNFAPTGPSRTTYNVPTLQTHKSLTPPKLQEIISSWFKMSKLFHVLFEFVIILFSSGASERDKHFIGIQCPVSTMPRGSHAPAPKVPTLTPKTSVWKHSHIEMNAMHGSDLLLTNLNICVQDASHVSIPHKSWSEA